MADEEIDVYRQALNTASRALHELRIKRNELLAEEESITLELKRLTYVIYALSDSIGEPHPTDVPEMPGRVLKTRKQAKAEARNV